MVDFIKSLQKSSRSLKRSVEFQLNIEHLVHGSHPFTVAPRRLNHGSTKPARIMDMPRSASRENNKTQPRGEVSDFAKRVWSWWFLPVFCCLVFPELCWVVQIYPFKQQKATITRVLMKKGPKPGKNRGGKKHREKKEKKHQVPDANGPAEVFFLHSPGISLTLAQPGDTNGQRFGVGLE